MPRRLLLAASLVAALAAPSLSARTHVWKGAASNLFSDHRNWIGGSPAGDPEAELVFPLAVRQAVVNDLEGLTVKSMRFETDGYRIDGNGITLVEGAEIDARDVELGCELLFGGHSVEAPSNGHAVYSRSVRAAAPAVIPSSSPATSSVFEFDSWSRTMTARVTPGAETTWHFDGRTGGGDYSVWESRQLLRGDTDGDGLVRWNLDFSPTSDGVWCVLDQTAGVIHAAMRNGVVIETAPLEVRFLRDRTGNYTWADIRHDTLYFRPMVWIRPGMGSWRVSSAGYRSP